MTLNQALKKAAALLKKEPRDMTRTALADYLNVSPAAVSQWDSRRIPREHEIVLEYGFPPRKRR